MTHSTRLLAIALLLASGAALPPASAQGITDYQLIDDTEIGWSAGFGRAVAVSGDRALVSAPNASGGGLVYAYERVDGVWTETQRFRPSSATSLGAFGNAMDMEGDRALIGAYRDGTGAPRGGAAYVFELQGGQWVETAVLVPSDVARDDEAGSSVSLDGDRAVVASHHHDAGSSNTGAAYVFEYAAGAWAETAKLTASDAAEGDLFGTRVALSGDHILVNAFGDDQPQDATGAIYAFQLNGTEWNQEQKITDDLAGPFDSFGYDLALDGSRALIGGTGERNGTPASGFVNAYEFVGGTWTETQTVLPASIPAGASVGQGIALDGDHALIGARGVPYQQGTVYVFTLDNGAWTEGDRFTTSEGGLRHSIGGAVALSDGRALVGDYYSEGRDYSTVDQAYAFDLGDPVPQVTLEIESYNSTPERGESVFFRGPSTNVGTVPVRAYYWSTYETPDGRTRRTNLGGLTLQPGQTINFRQFRKNRILLPADAPEGDYTVTVYVSEKDRFGPILDSDLFVIKLGPLAQPGAPTAKAAEPTAGPNPFRDRTSITYTLAESAEVDLRVLDALGREVAVLASGVQAPGPYAATFDARGLPSGTYLWRLSVDGEVTTGRLTLAR